MTPIDQTHGAMIAAPENEQARLAFYNCLSSAELFLALEEEPSAETLKPMIFPIEDGAFIAVFDTEERLAEFGGDAAIPFAALTGRAIAQMVHGQDIGLALNVGVAPSEQVLTAEIVSWLYEVLQDEPTLAEALPTNLTPPQSLPDSLITALDLKLAGMAGMARCAYLAQASYKDGATAHVLAFLDAPQPLEPAIAQSVAETLTFSGIEAGQLDVMFINATDPIAASFAKTALRFDLPELPEPTAHTIAAPGSDPERPPQLR